MYRKHALFINIDNNYRNYAWCFRLMQKIKNNTQSYEEFFNTLKTEIIEYRRGYKYDRISSYTKLEEPLDGKTISSTITRLKREEVKADYKNIFDKIHFHIRIHSKNASMKEYLTNLHYISLLLAGNEDLISENRLSIFLVPRNSSDYPFTSMQEDGTVGTDTELYREASAHLRAIIHQGNYGIIYGVAAEKKSDYDNIVKALDYKITSKNLESFPLIVLRDQQESDKKVMDEYIKSDKLSKSTEPDKEKIGLLNHYNLLFDYDITGIYFRQAIKLRANRRFGFANSDNIGLALIDFIFESAYLCLKRKFTKSELELEQYFDCIYNNLQNTCLFTFAVFSFIFKCDDNIENNIKNTVELAIDITNALNQIIQNSLQHSEEKFCAVTFMLDENDSESKENNLRIIISDLGRKTIMKSFSENLQNEIRVLDKLSEHNSIISEEGFKNKILEANTQLSSQSLKLKNFFNEFDSDNTELTEAWYKFRQTDSSAHIGLALFANIINQCKGKFYVCSSDNFTVKESDYYISVETHKPHIFKYAIPGTCFNISLPVKVYGQQDTMNMAQLRLKSNCYDNYETYAKYIDCKKKDILYNEYKQTFDGHIKYVENSEDLRNNQKISKQFIWSDLWMHVFTSNKLGLENMTIYNIDYEKQAFKEYVNSNRDSELMIKGLISSLGVYAEAHAKHDIKLAVTNISDEFIRCFEEVTLSLSLKKFPDNLQLFISNKKGNKQIHMFGNTYGEAIQSAYIISIEQNLSCYDSGIYGTINNLFEPFRKYITVQERDIYIVPFTSFLPSENSAAHKNIFFSKISEDSEKSITEMRGYKLDKMHIRLGNKVHMDQFYEMSFMFYRTLIANRVAFEILKDISKSGVDLLKDTLLFYGYASYSQAILMSITTILTCYRKWHTSEAQHTYAVYQYNLQYEANADNIQIYYKDYEQFKENKDKKVIQIVPISSTLTTFGKMWSKFVDECDKKLEDDKKHKLVHNHTVLWVRDDAEQKTRKASDSSDNDQTVKETDITDIEENYFYRPKNGYVDTKIMTMGDCRRVHYIFTGRSYWQKPEECKLCYPDNLLDEIPLIETDPTSTVPAQQIYPVNMNFIGNKLHIQENNERIAMLKKLVYYGHVRRGKNHYQYYINTQDYFDRASVHIQHWLIKLRQDEEQFTQENYPPCLNVIFSPEHNTNVGFSQYVNAYYFNGMAEVISINEDKEFRSNFICEHAALRNTISMLFEKFYTADKSGSAVKNYRPVKFYFADDDVISGATIHKASNLLQSLIPKEYLDMYTTGVFEKCFILIDRISGSSKAAYVIPTENFHSFCHLDVSNMRKQGDSCIGCKLLNDSIRLMNRSSTKAACDYWSGKVISLRKKSFEKISSEKECKDEHYYRLVLSHVVKNLFDYNKSNDADRYADMIFELFGHFMTEKKKYRQGKYYNIINQLLEGIIEEDCDKKTVIKCLIKIITRPFITFNHSIKTQVLRFIIMISEKIINQDFDKEYPDYSKERIDVIEKIIKLFHDGETGLVNFVQNCLFEAVTDLHSTYLMRKNTIKNTLSFIQRYEGQAKDFLLMYSFYIQKIVDGSSDETRTLRLEHLMITGNDEYDECDGKKQAGNAVMDISIFDKTDGYESEAIRAFCQELFLSNGHLLIDGLKKCKENKKPSEPTDEYFMKRWKAFRDIDSMRLSKKTISDKECDAELELYKVFSKKNKDEQQTGYNSHDSNIIKERYENLLKKIQSMIVQKYGIIDNNRIRLALLTRMEKKNEEPMYHRDLETVTYLISADKPLAVSNSKFIIKSRIIDAIKNHNLDKTGYYVRTASDSEPSVYLANQEDKDKTGYENDHRKPYFIIKFEITPNMLNADSELREIVPVYLYVSMVIEDRNERKILPWMVMRDILCYRHEITTYLVEDFTSDVIQRYAHSIGTEAILQHEKVISHSPIKDDKKLLEVLQYQEVPDNINKKLSLSTMQKWMLLRSYCNTIIAKLYNRVFRNINKQFDEIVDTNDDISTREVPKLYVPNNSSDGISEAVSSVWDILPDKNDAAFELFYDIIDFEVKIGREESKNMQIITRRDENGIEYTYNIDYLRNIIYRICFDALRFSPGAGAGVNNFYDRIVSHYNYKEAAKRYDDLPDNTFMKNALKAYKLTPACKVIFYVEPSNSSTYDWLVIENKLACPQKDIINKEISNKLIDPLDYTDGHMSLLTEKEYITALLSEQEQQEMNSKIFESKYDSFITRLPIIKKEVNNG